MNRIPVCMDKLSMEARLVYLNAIINADALGICQAIYHHDREIGLSREAYSLAIKELEETKMVSIHREDIVIAQLGNGGCVMDYRLNCWINDFISPINHDRLSPESWSGLREAVFERDQFTCQYCGATDIGLECDHVEPISRGGTNEMGNLVTSCGPCNKSKRDKLLIEWRGRTNGKN